MRSQNARLPPPVPGIAQTWFFGSSSIRANTLKPEPRKCSETSCIMIGLRRSGLSLPYFFSASANGIRGQPFGHRLALGELLEHARDDRLDRGKNVLLLDKAHFEVELVEFARQAVGARILVAETRRDLEVAVEARHHQQLLVLLRRLRQRVEFAGMNPRRHQKIPRALRRGRRQDRGLELEEALLLHPLAHGIDDRAAGHDVLVQLLATQVEEAVLKPDVFRIFLLAEHRQRQLGRRPQHLDLANIDFDHAGRQFRVIGAIGTAAHLAVDPHHPFRAELFDFLERRRIRVGHALGQPVMIAQIDEQHAAMVADAMAPAGKTDGLADVAFAKRAACM